MRRIRSDEEAGFHGEFVDFHPIGSRPKPARAGDPRALLGAASRWTWRRIAKCGDGWFPIRQDPARAAASGAIEGMTRSIAVRCLESGCRIRRNSIHPGVIDKLMLRNFGQQAGSDAPQPRAGPNPAEAGVLGVPQNAAELAAFLASDESAFIAAQEFVIDGGMSMLPAPPLREAEPA